MRKLVDSKNRPLQDVMVYTGVVPSGLSTEEFHRRNNSKFPDGYYISVENFFSDIPTNSDKIITFPSKASKYTNGNYKGMQFLKDKKSGRWVWFHYVDKSRLERFKFINNGKIDIELVEEILKLNSFNKKYTYFYNTPEKETIVTSLWYNVCRNVIVKVETDGFMKVMVKLYDPTGILKPSLLFNKSVFSSKNWTRKRGIDIRKMVKPSFNSRFNKHQLDYIEKDVKSKFTEMGIF